MHTTEQARELWCPMVRLHAFHRDGPGEGMLAAATFNRVEHGNSCIAEECAMWRWADSYQAVGFCGLAGRPEVAA